MATPHQLRSYGRIGLLATTLVLAAALVFGAWSNYVGAREAMGTLYRGQADIVKAALRGAFHPWDAEPDSAALRAFVDSFPQFGVTYLAVVDSRGSVLASVGSMCVLFCLTSRTQRLWGQVTEPRLRFF